MDETAACGYALITEGRRSVANAGTHDPVEPRRRKVALERSGDLLELRCRSPQSARGCFLVLWLVGWTVGCVFLAGAVLKERQLFMLDKDNREFCSVKGMTLGEARWMADAVLRERAAWFG